MNETETRTRYTATYASFRDVWGPWSATSSPATFVPFETFTRAPLVKGDHVKALPYWSRMEKSTVSDVPHLIRAMSGSVATSLGKWRMPTPDDIPLRPSPYSYPDLTMFEDTTWNANLARYVTWPDVTVPSTTVEVWKRLESLADTKALGNLRKAMANLPMIFAERRETLALAGRYASRIARTVKAAQDSSLEEFRKVKPKNRSAVAKAIADEHLSVVFGLLPLIGEVEGMVEYLNTDRLDFIRSRGLQVELRTDSSKYSQEVIPDAGWPNLMRGSFGKVYTGRDDATQFGVRTALRYKLSSRIVADLSRLGFEPIGTAFDLVPLSFVTGWVSNFDYWIRDLSPKIGLEFETGSRNRRALRSVHQTSMYLPESSYAIYQGSAKPFAATKLSRLDQRTVIETEPEASLSWDVEVGVKEIASGISLTLQRTLKPLKRSFAQKQFRYKGPKPKWLSEIRYTGRK
ncbi:MAG: putative maturation protein [Pepevirus faecihabitans]|uniref:Maturation protein n=1 Tax=Leviviridae sp. TaxID=2027243 RepID=A0ABY3STP4_9VIRU|nr:MAG: putative maturation protein [Leviviridae sp.]